MKPFVYYYSENFVESAGSCLRDPRGIRYLRFEQVSSEMATSGGFERAGVRDGIGSQERSVPAPRASGCTDSGSALEARRLRDRSRLLVPGRICDPPRARYPLSAIRGFLLKLLEPQRLGTRRFLLDHFGAQLDLPEDLETSGFNFQEIHVYSNQKNWRANL